MSATLNGDKSEYEKLEYENISYNINTYSGIIFNVVP